MKNNDWHDSLAALRNAMGAPAPEESVEPEAESDVPQQKGRLDIIFEKKGRAGKCATIISGFTLADEEVDRIAAGLKRSLGCGGSSRGGEILIQGDRRQDVLRLLTAQGLKARII